MVLLIVLLANLICFQINAENNPQPKRAIVIGASVGMGKEISKRLAAEGYTVGMGARRIELIEQIQKEIPTQTYAMHIDASQVDDATQKLSDMIETMGGLDLLILASSGFWDCDFASSDWTKSMPVLSIDVVGFFALARTGLNYFERQGYGHLVGFTSIDGLHGGATFAPYSAAKIFGTRYLQAERNKYIQRNIPISVTEICPGFINSKQDVDYTQIPGAYWVETLSDATDEIFQAIQDKVPVAYITKRWQKVAELLAWIPHDLYNALSARPGGGF